MDKQHGGTTIKATGYKKKSPPELARCDLYAEIFRLARELGKALTCNFQSGRITR